MAKKEGRDSARGEAGFRGRYIAMFGERWPLLEAALAEEPDFVAFRAPSGASEGAADGAATEAYFLDSASIFAARCLLAPSSGSTLPADARILDACAAPGGKSIVLASFMGPEMRLVSNELSADRARRLGEALDRHLPPELRSRVSTMRRDAAAMCRSYEEAFDAILLDAPCSSERHVLRQSLARTDGDRAALAQWSPARVRGLATRQWSLLSSALIMLKPGGLLVYSTCALGDEENDRVVARAISRYGSSLVIECPSREGQVYPDVPVGAERTEFGLSILPDRARGAGPMYVCRLRKIL